MINRPSVNPNPYDCKIYPLGSIDCDVLGWRYLDHLFLILEKFREYESKKRTSWSSISFQPTGLYCFLDHMVPKNIHPIISLIILLLRLQPHDETIFQFFNGCLNKESYWEFFCDNFSNPLLCSCIHLERKLSRVRPYKLFLACWDQWGTSLKYGKYTFLAFSLRYIFSYAF